MTIQICFVTHTHVEQHDSPDEQGVFLFSLLPAGCCKVLPIAPIEYVYLCFFAWDYAYVRIYTHKYLSEKIICCLVKWYVKFPIYCLSKELTGISLDRKVHYLCAQFIYWLEYHLHARAVIIESGEEISFLSPLNLFTIEVLGLLLFHMKNSSRGIMLL